MVNLKKVVRLSLSVIISNALLIFLVYPLFKITSIFNLTPLNLTNVLLLSIGSFVVVYSGFLIYEQKYVKLWKGRNLSQRLFAILLYGTFILVAALFFTTGISLDVLTSLAFNLALVSILTIISLNLFKFPRV